VAYQRRAIETISNGATAATTRAAIGQRVAKSKHKQQQQRSKLAA